MKKLIFILLVAFSCGQAPVDIMELQKKNEQAFRATMQKHLDAVSNKNIDVLKSTMSPEGKMTLLLPGSEIIDGVDGFIEYHDEWFKDTTTVWTFETKIVDVDVAETMGIAITEIIYREPERDGKPYFNRMHVSYGLEKLDGSWYIIKDQACSIEKSTDPK